MRLGIIALLVLAASVACAQQGAVPVDSILIPKKDHALQLIAERKLIRTYKAALGSGGLARKQQEGDGRTPQGHYAIDSHNAASHYTMRSTSLIRAPGIVKPLISAPAAKAAL